MKLTKQILSIGLLLSLASGAIHATTNDQEVVDKYSTLFVSYEDGVVVESGASQKDLETLELEFAEAKMKQNTEIEKDYNALADAIENNPESVINDISLGKLITIYRAAGVWFLMESVKHQIKYIEKFNSLKQEGNYNNTILMSVNGIFGAAGMAMMIPAALEYHAIINYYSANRYYKNLLSKKIKIQGKIDAEKKVLSNLKSIEHIPKEKLNSFLSKYPGFQGMKDHYELKLKNAKVNIVNLEAQALELDEKIKANTPAPRVSNFKSKFKGGLKLAGLTFGAYAGIKVLTMAGTTHDILSIETNDLSSEEYYNYLTQFYEELSDLHSELVLN